MAGLTLSGCGTAGTPVVDSTRAVAVPVVSAGPFHGVADLPATVGGSTFDAASLAGRPVVLWFWAPWCAICRSEAPAVTKVASEYAGRVSFVGVAGQGSLSDMNVFVNQTHAGAFPQLADVNNVLWKRFAVSAQPAFAFITATGGTNLVVGSIDQQSLRARVAQLTAGLVGTAPDTGRSCTSGASHKPGSLDCGSAGPHHTSGGPSTAPMTTR
ncbi:thioredoxin domain-containing protein [Nostocoides sp. HKS02]|uniref:thioredoxin domain-containing protein n=1 Tax=Nostocoides sp. HKS02 TaxID=1813880 RepID=UPI001E3929DA|nr:thioredoxin domain-containing protein [Tetrasphaera sp. HKS02]